MALNEVIRILARLPKGTKALMAGLAGLTVLLWPRRTTKVDYIDTVKRDQWYGPIQFIPNPTQYNPEGIYITNDFEARNIIYDTFPLIGRAGIHRLAAPSLRKVLKEIESRGWGHKVKSFQGGFYPRFVRKSTMNLSSHSYGTSIDINADNNPQGGEPTQDQTELAPIFEKHGWYWGDKFRPTRDPMHFEYVVPPRGMA